MCLCGTRIPSGGFRSSKNDFPYEIIHKAGIGPRIALQLIPWAKRGLGIRFASALILISLCLKVHKYFLQSSPTRRNNTQKVTTIYQ